MENEIFKDPKTTKPKVSLSFELSRSGLIQLNSAVLKADETVMEEVKVEKPKKSKKSKTEKSEDGEKSKDEKADDEEKSQETKKSSKENDEVSDDSIETQETTEEAVTDAKDEA